MAERTNSARMLTAIALLCAAMAGAVFSIGRLQKTGQGAPYSSLGTGRTGLQAVRMLLEARGCMVETMGIPLSQTPAGTRLLFVIQPSAFLTKEDQQTALDRVRKGMTLVLMGSAVQWFSETLKVRVELSGDNDVLIEPQAPAEYLSGIPGILVPVGARFQSSPGKEAIDYFADENGGVFREYILGRGRIIAVSDANLFANEVVDAAPGNALLCLALAEFHGHTAVFAEYYHGIRSAGVHTRSPIPLYMQLAFWQVVIVLALAVLIAGWRFGQALPMPVPAGRRSIGEYVRSMGGLYRKAGAGQIVLDDLYRNLMRSMQKYCGYNHAVPAERLIRECAFRRGLDPAELGRLVRRCEEVLNGRAPRERELMMLGKEIDRYRKEFERYGSGE